MVDPGTEVSRLTVDLTPLHVRVYDCPSDLIPRGS